MDPEKKNLGESDDATKEAEIIWTQEQPDESETQWTAFESKERAWKKIRDYAVLWDMRKNKGIIKIILKDDVRYKIVVNSPQELDALANIFRQEKVVFYNIVSGAIATAWKSTGGK